LGGWLRWEKDSTGRKGVESTIESFGELGKVVWGSGGRERKKTPK